MVYATLLRRVFFLTSVNARLTFEKTLWLVNKMKLIVPKIKRDVLCFESLFQNRCMSVNGYISDPIKVVSTCSSRL